MILNPGKWLFVSTMKCATNSLYTLLQDHGGHWAGSGNFHGIPLKRMAPIHWTCCRNPYDRAVSIWASTCVRCENQKRYGAYGEIVKKGGDPLSFEDFAIHILAAQPLLPNPYLWRNQADWHDRFIVDKVIHVEHLAAEIEEALGFHIDEDAPMENTSVHDHFEQYYKTGQAREIVAKWAEPDFERFGYAL